MPEKIKQTEAGFLNYMLIFGSVELVENKQLKKTGMKQCYFFSENHFFIIPFSKINL